MAGGMPYRDFLNAVIDDGIEEVREAYAKPGDAGKRDGAIRGFEECRGREPSELLLLQAEADRAVHDKRVAQAADYWYWRYRALQVGWVLNVLSAAEHAAGREPHVPPTARGMLKAADILGVAEAGPAP
jgi:hypothetical protein